MSEGINFDIKEFTIHVAGPGLVGVMIFAVIASSNEYFYIRGINSRSAK